MRRIHVQAICEPRGKGIKCNQYDKGPIEESSGKTAGGGAVPPWVTGRYKSGLLRLLRLLLLLRLLPEQLALQVVQQAVHLPLEN